MKDLASLHAAAERSAGGDGRGYDGDEPDSRDQSPDERGRRVREDAVD